MPVEVNGSRVDIMVDSGATISTVKADEHVCTPTPNFVTTVGVSGVPVVEPLSQRAKITVEGSDVQHSFLISEKSPINLMGRDLLCKLHATIQCTPDGLFLSLPDVKAAHAFQFLKTIADCLYCWSLTDFNMASSFTVSSIQKIAQISPACATQMSAMRPVLQCHCTAAFNPPEVYKQLADVFLNTQEGLECEQCLFVGPQGCAIPIRLSDAQRKLVNDKDSFPYITVAVSPGCDPQQLESMVAQCQALRGAAQTPQTQTITHLGLELYMLSLTEHIQLPQSRFVLQQPPLPTQYGPPSELSEVPSILWAKHKNHVGFVNSAPPHEVTLKPGAKLPMVRQYNLPHKSIAGIEGVIQSLLDQGVLVQTTSPCNTPILPIPKANRPDEWRFVQDLQAINSIVVPTAPIVPDTNSILASLPSNSTHYTVIDLSSAFFSIPLHPDSQYLFAFTFKGKQYTWQRLPQGFVESPTVYAAAVKRDLDDLHFPGGSTLLQYADDLLIASPSQEACRTDSILLLQRLAECGHRASLAKLQFCRSEVTYLGHVLKNGQRLLSPERLKLLVNMPPPTTKKQMLSFLGMANYCRHWIFEYAAMDSVLRNATLQSAPPKVQWTEDMNKAFQDLKHALTLAPALGLPDYHQPFHLHVHERDGFATGILVQKHGSHYRPVAYYSSRLTPVVLGMPGCLRAVAAVAIMIEKSSPIVLAHDCVVHVPHAVLHILNTSATQHMTAARRSGYEAIILHSPHITLKRSPPLNPATLLPLIDTDDEHDCITTIDLCTSPRPDLLQTPIPNSDLIFYTDGSASRPSDSTHLAGYAVVNDWGVVEAKALPPGTSAQAAELYALTRACILASGKVATIYTDSRYAFGAAHDFGQLWKMRGFVSSSGKPLQHHTLVNDLLDAILRPSQLAIIKCAAHTNGTDPVSRGNAMADTAAKQAALSSPSLVLQCASTQPTNPIPVPSANDVVTMQNHADDRERSLWLRKGCKVDAESGLWLHPDGRPVCPRALLHVLARVTHGPAHVGRGVMNDVIRSQWFAPGITQVSQTLVDSCMICQQTRKKNSTVKHDHLEPPSGPFVNMQIDFVHMPSSQGFKYLLVITDRFSKWVEAFATKKEDARTVVKCLLKEVIPRYGVPQGIDSDRGPAFVSKITQGLSEILGFKWQLHVPYHPQSSGQVERMNATIKDRLTKTVLATGLKWPDALPIVLYSIRSAPSATTGLSPHEVLMGRPMSTGTSPPLTPHKATLLWTDEFMTEYVKRLTEILRKYHLQVADRLPKPSEEPIHSFREGDLVLIKSLEKVSLSPRWKGPYQVLQMYGKWSFLAVVATASVLIVAGVNLWEKHQDSATEKEKRNVKSDYCLKRYGGIELDYVEGESTTYQFDLCDVMACKGKDTSWRGYDVYVCATPVVQADCAAQRPPCGWTGCMSFCSNWGQVVGYSGRWDPQYTYGPKDKAKLISLTRGQLNNDGKGANPLLLTIQQLTGGFFADGHSSSRVLYLMLGVEVAGSDPQTPIKVNFLQPTTNLPHVAVTPTPGTILPFPAEKIKDQAVVQTDYQRLSPLDVIQMATGYTDENLWLKWVIQNTKEQMNSDCVSCAAARPHLVTAPAPLHPEDT
ncbi:uncharacterized protein LOC121893578 [Thunnus maccoyii]|uniref:uncharacterized protein LOC121893578 n=1 Tax=Thunnus maccoyii TaxID=8240 RepID=UPI001C4CB70C|nr:uncharacterized protein LOC121893578 [Thunnus maccoyii]